MTRIEKLQKLLQLRNEGISKSKRIQMVKAEADEDLDRIETDEEEHLEPRAQDEFIAVSVGTTEGIPSATTIL